MDLYDALGLRSGSIVAAVGGGGKTSLAYALAAGAATRGDSAIIVSSTKFTRPPGEGLPPVFIAAEGEAVELARRELRPGASFVLSSGRGARNRLLGYQNEAIAGLALLRPGLLSIEADGSAHRPFKAPADHEPAIPPCTTDVVVCVGLEVLGMPLDDRHVHRPHIVAALADIALGDLVTVETIVRVLSDPAGGRKGVPPGARLHALLNNPQTHEHERLGAHLASRLVYEGFHRAVVATAHRPGDVRALVT